MTESRDAISHHIRAHHAFLDTGLEGLVDHMTAILRDLELRRSPTERAAAPVG